MQNLGNMQFFCKHICAHCLDCSTTYVMSIIVSNCQHCESNNFEHCHVYTTDFFSNEVKLIHTSTVTMVWYGNNLYDITEINNTLL